MKTLTLSSWLSVIGTLPQRRRAALSLLLFLVSLGSFCQGAMATHPNLLMACCRYVMPLLFWVAAFLSVYMAESSSDDSVRAAFWALALLLAFYAYTLSSVAVGIYVSFSAVLNDWVFDHAKMPFVVALFSIFAWAATEKLLDDGVHEEPQRA